MAKQQVEDAVEAIAQELLKDQDVIELVDVEYVKEHDWYLRVYIDKEGGIDIEDCQALSEKLEAELDKGDVVPDSYILEVSSPGIDRVLRKPRDFTREQGKKVGLLKIRCMRPFPVKEIVEVVKNAKFVGVLEKDVSFGFEGVVYTDVCSALKSAGVEIPAANYVGGLGGRSIYKTDIEKIYEELLAGTAKVGEANFVNLRRDICGA